MTDPHARVPIVLDRLPQAEFEVAVTYLTDVLRECQLLLVDRAQGTDRDPALSALADGLLPDLEEVGDAWDAATITDHGDGTVRIETVLAVGQSGTLAHLQMQLIQLRLLGRTGGLLVQSDPEVSQLLTWIWEEISDQLHGRPARPYHRGA